MTIVQRRFTERGVAVFADRRRGRRTPPRMTFQEEEAFLDGFRAAAASVLVVGDTKAAWEGRLGRTVHKTTVYLMLERHGWRKAAPRPRRPKKGEGAGEAFKRVATPKGSPGRGQGRRGSR